MRIALATIVAMTALLPRHLGAATDIVVIEGLGGEAYYEQEFMRQSQAFEHAAQTLREWRNVAILRGDEARRDNVVSRIGAIGELQADGDRLIVVLLGHGSFDGHEYRFNIPGPDLTDAQLRELLDGAGAKKQLVVVTTSASGVLSERLASDTRIIVTATRNGFERNATRFGEYFALALSEPSADLNKDSSVSAQEAYEFASRSVRDYFEGQNAIATEHAVIRGTGAGDYTLARLGESQATAAPADPELAELVLQRTEWNTRIAQLQAERQSLGDDEYLDRLQELLLQLALTEEAIEARNAEIANAD